MVLGIDRDLHVVPDDAGTAPTRRHRAGVRIGERDLLVGRGEHLFLDRREALHLAFEFREFFLEPRRLERERLRRLLPIGRVELAEIPRNALFICARRRSPLARVKCRSRLFTALNLLPSMATLAFVRSPISRQSSTKRAHTLRIAGPLSLRKSAIVL